jgi:hypothetical protein
MTVQMALRLSRPLGGGPVGSADLRLSEQICGGPRASAAVLLAPTAAQVAPS